MTSRISKGSITGRKAFSNGGLGLSIGSRVGGARRMITARAPDTVKIAGGTQSNNFKIRKIDGIISYSTTTTQSEPYLEQVSVFYDDANDAIYPQLFEKKLTTLAFMSDLSGDETIKVSLQNPQTGIFIESLFQNTASNVHEFQFPDISYNFTLLDISNNDRALYLNDGKFTDNDTNKNNTITALFIFDPNTMTISDVNDTFIPLIDNKKYTITMNSDSIMDVTVPGLSSGNPRTLTLDVPIG